LFVIVSFCRDTFSRNTAEQFLTLASLFQNQTNGLVSSQRIFTNGQGTPMLLKLFGLLTTGFFLGMQHSLDADHVAAVPFYLDFRYGVGAGHGGMRGRH